MAVAEVPPCSTSTPGWCTTCVDLHHWTAPVPLARALFYCCLVPWQLWNSGEEPGRGPRAQAGLSRVDVVKKFSSPRLWASLFPLSFVLFHTLLFPPPLLIVLSLPLHLLHPVIQNAGKLWRDAAYMPYTHRQA